MAETQKTNREPYQPSVNEVVLNNNTGCFASDNRATQIQKPYQEQKIRTSSMPGSPRNQKFDSSKPDIATEFNRQYAKKGLQPFSLDDIPNKKPQPPETSTTSKAKIEYGTKSEIPKNQKLQLKLKAGTKSPEMVLASKTATVLNGWIWSAGFSSWLMFQLPFAILSLMFLGISATVEALYKGVTQEKTDDGFIVSLGKNVVKAVTDVATATANLVNDKVLGLFGIDLTIFDPMNFFLITYLMVLAYGIFVLLFIYIFYKLAFLHPLSSKGGGMKTGMFLLALIGYSIPILNLFPWFYFWTLAVRIYPR